MIQARRVTIKDVAREAGVSTQTVSRVVNKRPNVLPETRAKVQRAIGNLGYWPNVLARGLSQGRSYTLGVVGFGLRYFGSASVLTGIEQKSNQLGYSMLLSLLDQTDPAHIDAILNNLLSRQVEGIIWAVPGNSTTTRLVGSKTQGLTIPVVLLNSSSGQGKPVAAVNNRLGGRLAAKHLVSEGYARIGIITGPLQWWEAAERLQGWEEALVEAGHTYLEELKETGDWSPASGENGFRRLYARSPDIDAVFVSNDQMALGVLQAARELGISVPRQLGVVGFDDIPEAAYFHPALTTVRQRGEAVGAAAVELMGKLIKDRLGGTMSHDTTFCIEPKLIVRRSSRRGSPVEVPD